jgi:RNA polymerase sigma-70 factor (ECF subfamily)
MVYSNLDTDVLLDRARAGDRRAENQLLLRNRHRLRTMVRLRLDPRVAARIDPSDVVQETLLEAHRRLADYLQRPPVPFYSWLRQIAWDKLVNLQQQHLETKRRSIRRETKPPAAVLSDDSIAVLAKRLPSLDAGPHQRLVRAEQRVRVREALQQIAEPDRELLTLRYMEELSIEEIGSVLGLKESAVKMRHLRALQRLRALLDESRERD